MWPIYCIAKNEVHQAWRRFQFRRTAISTGLADSGWLLHGLVRSMKPETCVEIGSARGHSTTLIALALEQNVRGHLWAVDPHDPNNWSDVGAENTLDALQCILKRTRLTHRVTIVRKRTSEAVAELPKWIDLAFIDGDHSYEGVKRDWEIVFPRMNAFGVVIFHDTLWDRFAQDPGYIRWKRENMGVPRFVEELRAQHYPVITINRDWGVSLVQLPRGGESLGPSRNSNASAQ